MHGFQLKITVQSWMLPEATTNCTFLIQQHYISQQKRLLKDQTRVSYYITVHSESIQTPSPFLYFEMLQPCAEILIHFFNYTKYPIMFIIFSKCIKKKKLKYHFDISIQTLYSVLSWSTFSSDFSLESFCVWGNKLCTPGFGNFLPPYSTDPLKLCQVGWGLSVDSHFQRFSIGFKSGLCLGHSRTITAVPPALSWLWLKAEIYFNDCVIRQTDGRLRREHLWFSDGCGCCKAIKKKRWRTKLCWWSYLYTKVVCLTFFCLDFLKDTEK